MIPDHLKKKMLLPHKCQTGHSYKEFVTLEDYLNGFKDPKYDHVFVRSAFIVSYSHEGQPVEVKIKTREKI